MNAPATGSARSTSSWRRSPAAVPRHLLLKPELAGEGDCASVAAVCCGAPARLIVDTNEAWTGRDVAAEAAALVPYGVELIEQLVGRQGRTGRPRQSR